VKCRYEIGSQCYKRKNREEGLEEAELEPDPGGLGTGRLKEKGHKESLSWK